MDVLKRKFKAHKAAKMRECEVLGLHATHLTLSPTSIVFLHRPVETSHRRIDPSSDPEIQVQRQLKAVDI